MIADLLDVAVLHIQDHIRVTDRRQPVCDNKVGAAFHQNRHRVLDHLLGVCVNVVSDDRQHIAEQGVVQPRDQLDDTGFTAAPQTCFAFILIFDRIAIITVSCFSRITISITKSSMFVNGFALILYYKKHVFTSS